MRLNVDDEKQLQVIHGNLRKLREEGKWTLQKLSEFSCIDKETIIALETEDNLDLEKLTLLCGIYNVDIRDIFYPLMF